MNEIPVEKLRKRSSDFDLALAKPEVMWLNLDYSNLDELM